MDNKIQPEDISIEILNENHNIADFKSYEIELVKFLVEDALSNQKQKLSLTFLWFYEKEIAGFITLLTDRINLEGSLRYRFLEKGVNYKTLPAIKIGRLCVHDNYLRRGLGTLMVAFAAQKANEINSKVAGCRFVTVDAKRDNNSGVNAIDFYKKINFHILKDRKEGAAPMFLDLKDNFIYKEDINKAWQNQ